MLQLIVLLVMGIVSYKLITGAMKGVKDTIKGEGKPSPKNSEEDLPPHLTEEEKELLRRHRLRKQLNDMGYEEL